MLSILDCLGFQNCLHVSYAAETELQIYALCRLEGSMAAAAVPAFVGPVVRSRQTRPTPTYFEISFPINHGVSHRPICHDGAA